MKYLFLTDDAEVASYVDHHGVHRIFLDLETRGKAERQRGKDTVMSLHRRENIAVVKAALTSAELLVRTNPLHDGTRAEIDYAIEAGADILMLPMFRSAPEVATFATWVRGRAKIVPLVETYAAVNCLDEILRIDGVTEIHIGLNDLHIDLGLRFLFEVVANGIVDQAAEICQRRDKPFGIGGIATLGGGLVPGELVLGEYVRLGSQAVILSRAFHQRAQNLRELQAKVDLPGELSKLSTARARLMRRTPGEIDRDRQKFRECVSLAVAAQSKAA